ncbi:MAG: response regulator, partial [Oceanipulchritudo sp.]
RTPMNGVLGMCTVLGGTELDTEQSEYLGVIHKSAEGLLGIIEDILDFSKIEAGRLELDQVDTRIVNLVEDALDLFSHKATEKGVELLHHISPDVPERLWVDPTRLRQILVNIIGNAVKFTDNGMVILRLQKEEVGEERVQLVFTIEDSGPGIDPLMKDHLFEAFNQLDSSTARKYGGTGLGLTISRKLAGLMGGDLNLLRSSPGGSTFQFTIEARPLAGSWLEPLLGNNGRTPASVLLVDSNPHSRRFYDERFRSIGAEVTSLESLIEGYPKEAVEADLLVINHPQHFKLDEAPVLKPDPRLKSREVIILANPGEARDWRVAEADSVAYLLKPLRSAALVRTLFPEPKAPASDESSPVPMKREGARPGPELGMLLRHQRILVVDDNETNLRVAKLLLKRHGLEVESVMSGSAAIKSLSRSRFDIVFLDLQMPEMDGFETSRALINAHPGLYVVAMTAAATADDRQASVEAGMRDFVSKPIKEKDLTRALWGYYHQLQEA